ncbi:MAG: SpoIID/LytB domain-containing protein [Eubacterium sp.]|nr:SpoIID/LytB domain-containing protein [Eubacterium sp.]
MGIQIEQADGKYIDGEEYVMGMAASELSYIREKEALKAWMIVCRTNLLKAVGRAKTVKESNLTLDYISQEKLMESNGKRSYMEYRNRLREASEETFGQVLVYEDELIDALYHQVSGGETISSKEIYDVEVPYLKAVESPQDVESAEYLGVKMITYKECAQILSKNGKKETEKSCRKNLTVTNQTKHGYVKEVSTKKNSWIGEEWKELFGLSSTCFSLENYEDQLRMVTLGRGHGMGLSLYGANALAGDKKAEQILSCYYPGVEIDDMDSYLP